MTVASAALLLLCVLLAALALFQLALVAGAPWGRLAWGGADRVLPARRRVASAVAIVLYALFAAVFLAVAGMIASGLPDVVVRVLAWVIVAYLALGTVMNALSRSRPERYAMAPLSGLLALLGTAVILL
ncbi:hypothetical protein [Leifsonia sp. C5G2]|uniref:hypothetical protein n=1 Tax=Leifsonia sp. C5G2 TaxID=2735269 RepID=UPI0032DEC0AB